MKTSEFKKLIREEVRKVILEANGTSELVLYTYDAFLFDYDKDEKDIMKQIIKTFEKKIE